MSITGWNADGRLTDDALLNRTLLCAKCYQMVLHLSYAPTKALSLQEPQVGALILISAHRVRSCAMHIRTATTADLADLYRIDSVALGHSARQDEIAYWLKNEVCQLIEIGGQAAAYGVLTNHFFGQPFIEMLMVGSQFRRHGLGMALILNFRASCSGSKLFSSTNMSNISMQNLLIKAGFKPSGYIENLDENDPEIVFYSPVP